MKLLTRSAQFLSVLTVLSFSVAELAVAQKGGARRGKSAKGSEAPRGFESLTTPKGAKGISKGMKSYSLEAIQKDSRTCKVDSRTCDVEKTMSRGGSVNSAATKSYVGEAASQAEIIKTSKVARLSNAVQSKVLSPAAKKAYSTLQQTWIGVRLQMKNMTPKEVAVFTKLIKESFTWLQEGGKNGVALVENLTLSLAKAQELAGELKVNLMEAIIAYKDKIGRGNEMRECLAG